MYCLCDCKRERILRCNNLHCTPALTLCHSGQLWKSGPAGQFLREVRHQIDITWALHHKGKQTHFLLNSTALRHPTVAAVASRCDDLGHNARTNTPGQGPVPCSRAVGHFNTVISAHPSLFVYLDSECSRWTRWSSIGLLWPHSIQPSSHIYHFLRISTRGAPVGPARTQFDFSGSIQYNYLRTSITFAYLSSGCVYILILLQPTYNQSQLLPHPTITPHTHLRTAHGLQGETHHASRAPETPLSSSAVYLERQGLHYADDSDHRGYLVVRRWCKVGEADRALFDFEEGFSNEWRSPA